MPCSSAISGTGGKSPVGRRCELLVATRAGRRSVPPSGVAGRAAGRAALRAPRRPSSGSMRRSRSGCRRVDEHDAGDPSVGMARRRTAARSCRPATRPASDVAAAATLGGLRAGPCSSVGHRGDRARLRAGSLLAMPARSYGTPGAKRADLPARRPGEVESTPRPESGRTVGEPCAAALDEHLVAVDVEGAVRRRLRGSSPRAAAAASRRDQERRDPAAHGAQRALLGVRAQRPAARAVGAQLAVRARR